MKFLSLISLLILLSFTRVASAAPMGDKDALVIIDMQAMFVTRGGYSDDEENKKKVQEVLRNQLEAIKLAKAAKIPIIFLEYEGFGNTNDDLKKEVEGYPDAKIFLKNTDGMFDSYNKHKAELVAFLESKNVKSLIITGANGGACVLDSISGSLDSNYNVIAYSKGIADFNYKEFIYPYDHHYNFTPTCADCKFKEVDNMQVVALELAAGPLKKSILKDEKINDTGRNYRKDASDSNHNSEQQNSEVLGK
ncbi:MAG: isochorismatase family protein [Rhizobacter sp.]|nr:isochorismatase family protein [Bacteriovorax sp.]